MKHAAMLGILGGLSAASFAGASYAAPLQPPMNKFYSAFYRCDENGAFNIAYDDKRPKTAKLTTSNNSKNYELKRTASPDGAAFSDGMAMFWTDGKTVKVEGTEVPLQNCKLQN